mmetsp:Transcript_3984/g.6256  ORF Transcript_3984/g.6256 Transcript_3984/m.6256 type:complete len:220 (+) Transcript_3984:304-963(+)
MVGLLTIVRLHASLSLCKVEIAIMHGVQNFRIRPREVFCAHLLPCVSVDLLVQVEVVSLDVVAQSQKHAVSLCSEHLRQRPLLHAQVTQRRGRVEGGRPVLQRLVGGRAVAQDVVGGAVAETGEGGGAQYPGVAPRVGVALVAPVEHARQPVLRVLRVDRVLGAEHVVVRVHSLGGLETRGRKHAVGRVVGVVEAHDHGGVTRARSAFLYVLSVVVSGV